MYNLLNQQKQKYMHIKNSRNGTDTDHVSIHRYHLEMPCVAEDVLGLLLPVIIESIYSLKTLNLLLRTSKSLRIAASDPRLLVLILRKMPVMTKTVLRKLFVLPESLSLPLEAMMCPYNMFRFVLRCPVFDAFQCAMVLHLSVSGMSKAFHVRQRRSASMKLVWRHKKEHVEQRWHARRCEIEQIYQDIGLIPCKEHTKSDAEIHYMTFGVIKRLSCVYRDKRKKPFSNLKIVAL
jgi:hypothetical protein